MLHGAYSFLPLANIFQNINYPNLVFIFAVVGQGFEKNRQEDCSPIIGYMKTPKREINQYR